ncbi:MAG TPA: molybdate ABC transporter substrate-binding protein [Opitutus sp.]|nr:molybdate ABC transporter substrate-binding protein [Opitutus sp.]
MGSLRLFFHGIFSALLAATSSVTAAEPRPARDRETLSIAAAANLVYALDAVNAAFHHTAPEISLTVATGASGSLVSQIEHGAPYDVLLSADVDYPRALIAAGHAVPATLVTFATGRLVLWTTHPDIPLESIAATVRSERVRKLALAHLDTAPYGRAAQQTLEALGAWTDAQSKIVIGENITQTAQFVDTRNADAGFVALSLVLSPKLRDRGRWLEVPAELHAPLDHAAVITQRGENNPAAARYLAFLRSKPAQEILQRFGYAVPRSSVSI